MGGLDARKQLHKDDRGSALAMIIVIIAFIAILASVLMFASYAGYRMRLVDKQGKNTFYTAETVLDEINVGLQKEVSAALSVAYEEIMTNYATEKSANDRNVQFRDLYFKKLQERLQMGSGDPHDPDWPVIPGEMPDPTRYSIGRLRSYLSSPESKGDESDPDKIGSREAFEEDGATWGAIVESDLDDPTLSYILDKNNNRILLKDLRVSYINQNGYVSIISTDIRIDLPDFNFAQSAAMPTLTSCTLIADDTLFLGSTNSGGSVNVMGDASAGQVIVGDPAKTSLAGKDGHISSAVYRKNESGDIEKNDKDETTLREEAVTPSVSLGASTVTFSNMEGIDAVNPVTLVSAGNIEVSENSKLLSPAADADGGREFVELWTRNLNMGSNALLDVNGSINVGDDLTLAGKESTVRLSGEYSGFGYPDAAPASEGEEEDGTGEGGAEEQPDITYADVDASSAIVINGRDSTLDLSGLKRMTISGRAYVGTRADEKRNPAFPDDENENKNKDASNIMMGESIAVKSNQLIYLAPAEAIGCVKDKNGIPGDSAFHCNPLTFEQYQEIIGHPDQYELLDGDKEIPELGYRPLSDYIDEVTMGTGEVQYQPEVVFRHTGSNTTLVYCYLRFPDGESANRYFREYYALNSQSVDKYLQLYAKDIKMADADELLYVNTAGNLMVYEGEEEKAWSVVEATDSDDALSEASGVKKSIYSSLQAKMVRESGQLKLSEMKRTMAYNVIDELEFENLVDAAHTGDTAVYTTLDGSAKMVLTEAAQYEVEGNEPQIVISYGDVTVSRNFTGLIIARGNITVAAGTPIEIKPLDVNTFSNILQTKVDALTQHNETTGQDDYYYLMNVFTDGISYAYSGNAAYDKGTARVSMADLISYERWTKK